MILCVEVTPYALITKSLNLLLLAMYFFQIHSYFLSPIEFADLETSLQSIKVDVMLFAHSSFGKSIQLMHI